ncbi:MAG: nuclear transport factor 2 family protein [Actinomycetota bacterium]|nr:nuclear transport factor 2 family protein [Actinomycetota bacterium]
MSRENVEAAKRYFDAFNAHGLEGTRHLRHPAWELEDPAQLPDAGTHAGEEAARTRVESFLELGWDGRFHVQEYIDADEEVVVVWQMRGRSALGDVPWEQTFAFVCAFEHGMLRRVRQYTNLREALEAGAMRG